MVPVVSVLNAWLQFNSVWLSNYLPENHLKNHRLRWGTSEDQRFELGIDLHSTPHPSHDTLPEYFTSDIPSQFICIARNDWPYSRIFSLFFFFFFVFSYSLRNPDPYDAEHF